MKVDTGGQPLSRVALPVAVARAGRLEPNCQAPMEPVSEAVPAGYDLPESAATVTKDAAGSKSIPSGTAGGIGDPIPVANAARSRPSAAVLSVAACDQGGFLERLRMSPHQRWHVLQALRLLLLMWFAPALRRGTFLGEQ